MSPAVPSGCAWGLVAFGARETNGYFTAPASQVVTDKLDCSGCAILSSAFAVGVVAFGLGAAISAVTGLCVMVIYRVSRRRRRHSPVLPPEPEGSKPSPAGPIEASPSHPPGPTG